SAVVVAGGPVLCACDAGSEFERLSIRHQDGRIEPLTADDADVEQVATDRGRTRRAWIVNRDGYGELVVDGGRVEGLPHALLEGARFLPDGSVVVTVLPPDDTVDVWVVPGPVRRTRSAAGGVPRDAFVRPTLERFTSFDGLEVPYFLYGEPGRPTLVYVHGGPESQFRPQLLSRGFYPVLNYLCARGLTVAAPNVRGSTGYGRTYHHLDDVEKRLDSVRDLNLLGQHLQ